MVSALKSGFITCNLSYPLLATDMMLDTHQVTFTVRNPTTHETFFRPSNDYFPRWFASVEGLRV